jgi:hypothetical protein
MGEFTLSRIRFRWIGEWTAETDFAKDDIVEYDGKVYTCLVKHTAREYFYDDLLNEDNTTIPPTPTPFWKLTIDGRTWRGKWAETTQYNLGNIVKYNGIVYICILQHTSGLRLESNIANWAIHSFQDMWKGAWEDQTFYSVGDVVIYGGILYRAIVAHTSANAENGLEATQGSWEIVARNDRWQNQWQIETKYAQNDIVRYGGITYRCNTGHVSALTIADGLELDQNKWDILLDNIDYKGNWLPEIPTANPPVLGTRYKVRDIVKYGASLWISQRGHTSTDEFDDVLDWKIWVPGLEFEEDEWDAGVQYQQGDIVRYGGYIYSANRNNINEVPSQQSDDSTIGDWKLLNYGYRVVEGGEWTSGSAYLVGDVVRRQGQVYVAIEDNNTDPNTTEGDDWELIIPGEKYQKEWILGNDYAIGDVVVFDGITYRCIQQNIAILNRRPDNDYDEIFWTTLIIGDAGNRLRYKGDIKTFGLTEDGSTIGTKRVGIGSKGQVLQVNADNEPSWSTLNEGLKVYYVGTDGEDVATAGNTLETPFRTVKYACDYIQADLPNRAPATLFIKAGVYKEVLPIKVPRDVAVVGEELRSTVIEPLVDPDNISPNPSFNSNLPEDPVTNPSTIPDPLDYRKTDMFWVNNGTGIRNMTLRGKLGELGEINEYLTRRPNGGSYVSLDPGSGTNDQSVWITNKSCYVQNVTTFGDGCVGLKIDGSLHDGGNRSIVANDFTQVCSDGIGVWCTNKGLTELVSVFSYYAHIGYLSENGGKIRATNGNSSYGDYGCVAEGVDVDESPISGVLDNRDQDAVIFSAFVGEQGNEILRMEYEHAGEEYSSANYTIVGSGSGASVVGDEIRDGGLFNLRLRDPADSTGTLGGQGLINVGNNAQGGDQFSIVIASNDDNNLAVYEGCRIIITSGTGVGQYGYITGYTLASKTITVSNERTGEPGWGHVNEGTPIEAALTPSTVYRIEPRVTFSPPPTSVDFSLTITGQNSWVDAASGNGYLVAMASDRNLTTWDGTTWVDQQITGSSTINRMKFDNGYFIAIGNGTEVFNSNDGLNWNTQNKPTTADHIGLAYGNGSWVAIESSGDGYAVSTDNGLNWTNGNTGVSASWVGLAHGSGKFVAIASDSNTVAVADDATLTWTTATIPGFQDSTQPLWSDITYGNGRFVAVSNDREAVAYSLDGTNWYLTELPFDADYSRVTYGQGVFMAFSASGGTDERVAISDGGFIWTELATGFSDPQSCGALHEGTWYIFNTGTTQTVVQINTGARAQGRVVIQGSQLDNFKIWEPGSGYETAPTLTLTDPNITELPVFDLRMGNGVLANPTFVNRGTGYKSSTTKVTVSGDGFADIFPLGREIHLQNLTRVPRTGANLVLDRIVWEQDAQETSATWKDIAYGNNRFVAVGNADISIYGSNGLNWFPSPENLPVSQTWSAIEFGVDNFVAFGDGSTDAAYSTNGINWNAVTVPYVFYRDVAYGTGTFVAVGYSSGVAAISKDDGLTWTSASLGTTSNWASVAFGNGKFIAVQNDSDVFVESSDGLTWIAGQLPSSEHWNRIAFGGNKFVIIGEQTNTSYVSNDSGTTWTAGTLPTSTNWDRLVFSNNRFLAMSSTSNVIASSADGITWKTRIGYPLLVTQAIGAGGQFFAALNNTQTARANDGTEEEVYKVLTITNVQSSGNPIRYEADLTVSPEFTRVTGPDHGIEIEIREKYSQVRLTGHDFLEIGTGNFTETNYPNTNLTNLAPFNEVSFLGGGRVFYASTDQDGNFRVGELFAVEQATGIVTISADYFDLQGLSELQLGGIQVGGTGVIIREFSTDATFAADSNNVVPTQRAIRAYIERRISGGGSNASTGTIVAGTVGIGGPNRIFSVLNEEVQVTTVANITGGIDGWLLAHSFFCDSFDSGLDQQEIGRDLA